MSQISKTINSAKRIRLGKIRFSYLFDHGREKEERNEEIQNFLLRSTEFRRSEFVEPRVKVYPLDEGYAYVPKSKDFTEDPKVEIWGNMIFRA